MGPPVPKSLRDVAKGRRDPRRLASKQEITHEREHVPKGLSGKRTSRTRRLWRASISARPKFERISLGRLEATAREVLFEAKPLSAFPQYELLVARYENQHASGVYTYPVRNRKPFNHYAFSLCGFSIIAKVDARRLPKNVQPCVINGSNTMIGIFRRLYGDAREQSHV